MFTSVMLLALAAGGDAEPSYEFKGKKGEDIAVTKDAKRTLFTITSQRGIGGATVQLKKGDWPENVTFRFQYGKDKGFQSLENITLTTDRIHAVGSHKVSGKFNFHFLDTKRKRAGMEPKEGESGGHLNVTVVARDGALEVTLPSCMLIGNGQVELSFIDAYRN